MKRLSLRSATVICLSWALAISTQLALGAGEKWTAPARAAAKKNPISADAASIARGKASFMAECMSCHGPTGRGDGPAAAGLEKHPGDLSKRLPDSDGALFWKITNGKSPMVAATKLSEEERWCVINYLRTLAR
ncbi:MAG TPA: cytochrome c class I [Spartobacteria bacterium]|jgi:mono/diheme cytochrome c family protein|nr:cytochrome c class I [Spartobacteria bacterium]